MNDKPSVLRDTDGEARRLARVLLRSARHAALAVIDPETGFPFASRVLVGTDIDAVPTILVSGLSTHTAALASDPRASLLAGEPGKGDPLAYPRLSVQCLAEPVDRAAAAHARIRGRFLDRHPKAKLYIDFPDFRFFRLKPQGASLNGGFGKAYRLTGEDLTIPCSASEGIALHAETIVRELLANYPRQLAAIVAGLAGENGRPWRVCGVDAAGFDIISGDQMFRHEFRSLAQRPEDIYLDVTEITPQAHEI